MSVFKKSEELQRRAASLKGTIRRCSVCAQENREGYNSAR